MKHVPFPRTSRLVTLRITGMVLITLVGVLIYANHLHNPFQFDTVAYIEKQNLSDPENMLTLRFFTQQYFSRSLLQMSLAVNALLGNQNPFGYHLLNLLLHIVNAILIFLISEKILRQFATSRIPEAGQGVGLALLAGLLFLSHPIQTESVLYIMSRSEILAATFYLLAFYGFLIYLDSDKKKPSSFLLWGTGIALLFVLGFGVKQTVITLPAVLLLYWLCISPANAPALLFLQRWRWPLAAIGLAAGLLLLRKLLSDETFLIGPVDPHQMVGRKNYMQTQPVVLVYYYLKLLLFPVNLNIDPDIPVITRFFSLPLLSALCVMAGILYLAIRKAASCIYLFCLGWFVIILSPSSSIVTLHDLAAEHRVYLAAYGIILAVLLIGVKAIRVFPLKTQPLNVRTAGVLAFVVLSCSSLMTMHRNLDWRSEQTLWEDTQKKSAQLVRPLINLARAHQLAGDTERAVQLYEESLQKAPNIFISNYNLGELQFARGKLEDALRLLTHAKQIKPEIPEVHGKLGELRQNLGQHEQAARHYQTAIELNPNYTAAMRNLGVLNYFHLGKPELGRLYFSRALNLDPHQPQAEQIRQLIARTPPPNGPS